MRNPVRSETDALFITIGGAMLVGVALVAGALLNPLVGAALVVGCFAGAVFWEVATKDPDRRRPLREAATAGRSSGARARPRALVVANRTLHGEALRAELRRAAADGAELSVVAPILSSRAHYIASDVDRELEDAHRRLDAALAWAKAEGIDATGKVGDPYVAFAAIEDELRAFGADRVIISTLPPGRSNWLEAGIVERLREELDIPITHVIVDSELASRPAA
jgi:hypothetical protein